MTVAPSPARITSSRWLITSPYANQNYLQPSQGAAQVGSTGAAQVGAQPSTTLSPQTAGAAQVGSQPVPQEEPQLLLPQFSFGKCSFGRRNFGMCSLGSLIFGSLKQLFFSQPQLLPQPLPHPSPQTAGAAQVGSTGAAQVGAQPLSAQAAGAAQVGAQPLSPQAAGAAHVGSTGAAQVGAQPLSPQAAGAAQVASTLQPHPLSCLNRPNRPACALLAIESTTRAAVSVIAFISNSPDIVLSEFAGRSP